MMTKKVENSNLLPATKEVKPAQMEQKKEILKTIENFGSNALKTAQDRINSAKEFEVLSKRYEQLKEKETDLNKFILGNDKTNAKITFQNAQGFNLEVRNSSIIEQLTQTAKTELQKLLLEAEEEIVSFSI